jgi:hypothetical protein
MKSAKYKSTLAVLNQRMTEFLIYHVANLYGLLIGYIDKPSLRYDVLANFSSGYK